tara:strand:- start:1008 stop:1223 length:216 start_codon:yes stop_codon:yes gene_type:complete
MSYPSVTVYTLKTSMETGSWIFMGITCIKSAFEIPTLFEAIKSQIDQLSFCTRRYTNLPAIKLAQKLVEIT